MEVNACQRQIKYLLSEGLKIRVLSTDRSTTIRAMMSANFPLIKHQFDPWSDTKSKGIFQNTYFQALYQRDQKEDV